MDQHPTDMNNQEPTVPAAQATLEQQLPALFKYHPSQHGVCITTPLKYADGSQVDVWLVKDQFGLKLTDHGFALRWLELQEAWHHTRASKRQQLFQDLDFCLGILLQKGQLELRPQPEGIAAGVMQVAQGIMYVSSLYYSLEKKKDGNGQPVPSPSITAVYDRIET